MKRSTVQVSALLLCGAFAFVGLAACVQEGRRDKLASPPSAGGFSLFYMDEGASVKLAYGAPNSDDVGFMMQCAKGSRLVSVSDVVRSAEGRPSLILASGGERGVLNAVRSDGEGAPLLTADAPSNAPPLRAFRRSGQIHVGDGRAQYDVVASPAEQAGVERFFSACERAA